VAHTNSRRPRPDRGIGAPSTAVVSERAPEAAYTASVGAGAALTVVSGGIAMLMWRRHSPLDHHDIAAIEKQVS
jgi:hypothetical protein